jgi:hypothetical protein
LCLQRRCFLLLELLLFWRWRVSRTICTGWP